MACRWDSWILDVRVCNWLGLWTGLKTVRWVGSLEYNWDGLSRQPDIMSKVTSMPFLPSTDLIPN